MTKATAAKKPFPPDQAEAWDKRYKSVPGVFRDMPLSGKTTDVAEFLASCGVSRVLDIGCGSGRWSILFASMGMKPIGIDISPKAIELAREWTSSLGLDAQFRVADVCELTGESGALTSTESTEGGFDAAVASSVLDYMPLADAKKAMAGISKVLRTGGLLFVSLDAEGPGGQEHTVLGDGTFVYLDGSYAGVMWRHYTDDEARELLADFDVLHWETTPVGDRWIYAIKR